MLRLLVIALAMLGLDIQASTVLAQTLTLDSYLHPPNEIQGIFSKAYLAGAKDGLNVLNAAIAQKYGLNALLFCPPPNLALTEDQVGDIVRRWVKDRGVRSDTPVAIVLLYGLEETFSCTKP